MADEQPGRRPSSTAGTSARLDRVGRPRASEHDRHRDGKEALYSTAPRSRPATPLEVRCERCEARLELGPADSLRLFQPPWLLNPWSRRLWARCPACTRRSWLQMRAGATVRMLWERPTAG